ncbi:MAG: YjcQ family protein [Lachnospiraceae bacterium]
MRNFTLIYRILKYLEAAMDYEEFDFNRISAEALGITEERWCRLMEMLSDDGYVKGIRITRSVDGFVQVSRSDPRITLKGLEYLNENSFMQKASNLAKGIADIIA